VGDYTADEKNGISHRARAAHAMARYLKKRYPNQSRQGEADVRAVMRAPVRGGLVGPGDHS